MTDAPSMPIKPDEIIEIILKRRWLIIVPFCFTMLVGVYLAMTLPKLYKAGTLILIQPQKVPTSFVQPIVSSDMETRISTISQQILSRSNLEKIIQQFKLFNEPENSKMFFEDKIEKLRLRIKVDVTRTRGDADAFSISYTGEDPEKVMQIANTLASFFIDESLKIREETALGTNTFLDVELESMRKRLEEKEAYLKTYRERYMGGLPEQLDTNLRVLDRLQEQLNSKQQGLRDAQNRLDLLNAQMLAREKSLESSVASQAPNSAIESGEMDTSLQLARLKEQLAVLKTRYTEAHPDIQRLQTIIAKMEKESIGKIQGAAPGQGIPSVQSMERRKRQDEVLIEIQTLKADIQSITNQIQIYQKRVEDTPKREQELLSIKRDYQNIMASYNSLLGRKLEAELAVNMEKKQKGEQFRIIDSARLPEKPVSPNMKKLFAIFVVIGIGIGGGFTFLLEFLDHSFKRPDDIESYLGIPVLATIPLIVQPRTLFKKRIVNWASILAVLCALMLLALFSLVTLVGQEKVLRLIHRVGF